MLWCMKPVLDCMWSSTRRACQGYSTLLVRRHRSHLRLGHREKRKRDEGIRGGYASAKQNFPRKIGIAAVRDHGITTRCVDAAEPSRCRRTRRG
jgi:hypothetical protein